MADDTMWTGGSAASNPFLGQENPYLQQMIDLTAKDMTTGFNRTTQPAFNAAMVNSGSFGNSGIDAANAAARQGLTDSIGDMSSKLRFGDYGQRQGMYQWQQQFDANNWWRNQDFNRATFNDAFGQQQANFQNGLGLLGMLSGMNANDLRTATAVRDTPLNYLTQFGNLGSTIGRGGQTQTTSGGGGNPLMGAVGGAQLGSAVGKWGQNQGWWGGNAPPSGYGTWGAYNYGMGGGGSDGLTGLINMNGGWGTF